MQLTFEFLRYFPTIKKFDIVASCLLPKEKGGIFFELKWFFLENIIEICNLIEKLVANKIIDLKTKEELKKVYFL